jgi:hypothetical protein
MHLLSLLNDDGHNRIRLTGTTIDGVGARRLLLKEKIWWENAEIKQGERYNSLQYVGRHMSLKYRCEMSRTNEARLLSKIFRSIPVPFKERCDDAGFADAG